MSAVTAKLDALLGPTSALIRSARDTLTIISAYTGAPLDLHRTANRLLVGLQNLEGPGFAGGEVMANIGIASFPADGHRASLLLKRARHALARTERWGRSGFCLFSQPASAAIADTLDTLSELANALSKGDLVLRFQPVIELAEDRSRTVLADVTWARPNRSPMDLDQVVSLAEQAGLIQTFNEWLITSLSEQFDVWRHLGRPRNMVLPLSRAQIVDGSVACLLKAASGHQGLTADRLDVEIDHRLLADATDHRLWTGLRQLRDLGVSLTASQIGEGPIVLDNLDLLPVDRFSLAARTIDATDRSAASARMVRALIGLAHELDMHVRAVNVRTPDQERFLRAEGCDEAIGPFLAPPLAGVALDRLTSPKPLQQNKNLKLIENCSIIH